MKMDGQDEEDEGPNVDLNREEVMMTWKRETRVIKAGCRARRGKVESH